MSAKKKHSKIIQLTLILGLFLFGTPSHSASYKPSPELSDAQLRQLRHVYTEPGELPQLEVRHDGKNLKLPLKHTDVQASLSANIARVQVSQTYENPHSQPIEAIYIFPLPENSAVQDMRMVIGDRTIRAEIKKRAEARQTYETAKVEGHTAALLEQERPNIFTQSVANIEPGKSIDVVLTYVQNLSYDSGAYEFVFPMVVGPRFNPGTPIGTRRGSGWGIDTDRVPDASRITPPILGEGMRSGHDISISVQVDAGMPIKDFDVPTHEIVQRAAGQNRLHLELAKHDSLPNRDFVLRYGVAGDQPQASLMTYRGEMGGFFSLMVQPPEMDMDAVVGQREIIFVVDISGSMSGVPLAMCQDAMRQAIKGLRPVDLFNVITFAGTSAKAFSSSVAANDSNTNQAMAFVEGLQAGGGTQMADAIAEALKTELPDARNRYVFFMTDGYVGNEDEILGATQKYVKALNRGAQKAKVFGFGVGSSVNRYLIDGLGKSGRGISVYATTREDPTLAVNKFYRYIDKPILEDVSIDWGGLAVEQIFPTQLPDVFASRPFIVHGRYNASGSGTVTVHGTLNGKKVSLPVIAELPEKDERHEVMKTLWARAKVEWLSRDLWSGQNEQTVAAITQLGLDFRMVTAFTSFVAVDRSKKIGGMLQTILQPVETPEGVDGVMAGAEPFMRSAEKSRGTYGALGAGAYAAKSGRAIGMGFGSGQATKDRAPGAQAPAEARGLGRTRVENKTVEQQESAASAKKGLLAFSGGLTSEQITSALANYQSQLKRCFEKTNLTKPTIVTVQWFVSASGVVLQPVIKSSTIKDAQFEECLLTTLKKVTFPSANVSTKIQYQFQFE